MLVAADIAYHSHHSPVIAIHDPDRLRVGVGEEARLVGVILLHGRVPVQVIGTQIREHANRWLEARRIVQLERRYLERNPFRLLVTDRNLGERGSNVACFDRLEVQAAQKMSDEGSRGGLAVSAGDGNEPRSYEKVERDFNLARDRNALLARESQWPCLRWNARAGNDERRARESLQIVSADVDYDALRTQLLRAPSGVG